MRHCYQRHLEAEKAKNLEPRYYDGERVDDLDRRVLQGIIEEQLEQLLNKSFAVDSDTLETAANGIAQSVLATLDELGTATETPTLVDKKFIKD
jgi:hypothetical protein